MEGGIDIRARGSRGSAIGLVLFGGFFALIWAASDTPELALFFIPFAAAAIRIASTRAWVVGDRLRVRNFWRSYELPRREIIRFDLSDVHWGRAHRARVVEAEVRYSSKRIRLSATLFTYFWLRPWPRPGNYKRNEADAIAAALNAWLHTGA